MYLFFHEYPPSPPSAGMKATQRIERKGRLTGKDLYEGLKKFAKPIPSLFVNSNYTMLVCLTSISLEEGCLVKSVECVQQLRSFLSFL